MALDDIIFDTFDGGAVRLPDATDELRARVLDRIPPIDQPVYGGIEAGSWLQPDDLVVGYLDGDVARAYPIKILNYHEIVNDEIGGVPVLVSYCPLCRSAIVYDRRVGQDELTFSNTGALHESDLVMVDRQTGSYWWQVLGSAIVGPLTETELATLPSEMATWGDWTARYPETLVLTRETGFARDYERDAFATYSESVDAGRFAFPVGESANDPRLLPSELVVVVQVGERVAAYAVEQSEDAFVDMFGETRIRVTPRDGGATVHEVEPDGSVGAQLPSRTSFWFAIVGAFPDVELRSAR